MSAMSVGSVTQEVPQTRKAQVLIAPDDLVPTQKVIIFLAGSIENGAAENWQELVSQQLRHLPVTILNPRRLVWDPYLEPSINSPVFRQQVEWELNGMEMSQIIVMNIVPGTISPISLLELGLYASSGKLIVHCPEGFFRKGNVDIVCTRYGIEQVSTMDCLYNAVEKRVKILSDISK